MEYMSVNGLEKKVSKLVFGTATPKLFAAAREDASKETLEEAYQLLDEVYEAGINTFDCAAHYGEEVLGNWMESRGNREKCVVITKCAHPNKWRDRVTSYDILSDLHDSLKKLKTDKIDIYMLHRDNHKVPVSEIVDTMNQLYEEGKITVFGGSNWTHQRIQEANLYAREHGQKEFTVSSRILAWQSRWLIRGSVTRDLGTAASPSPARTTRRPENGTPKTRSPYLPIPVWPGDCFPALFAVQNRRRQSL